MTVDLDHYLVIIRIRYFNEIVRFRRKHELTLFNNICLLLLLLS